VLYTLSANAGDTVVIHVERASGDLIPFLALRGANNRVIRSDVSATGRDAGLEYAFTEGGSYELTVTRIDAEEGTTTGDYVLSISGVPLTTRVVPNLQLIAFEHPALMVVERDTVFAGTCDDLTPSSYYLIYMRAGETVEARMEQSDGDLRPTLVLMDLALTRLIARGNIAEATESTLQATITETGWYALIAARFDIEQGTTSGRYRLTIEVTL